MIRIVDETSTTRRFWIRVDELERLGKAFGVEPPKYAHIPLILKTDGPGKMSKRDKGALIEEYQQRRYLPSAVRNYLCLLGWTPAEVSFDPPADQHGHGHHGH